MSNNPTATSVATINGTSILVIENGEKRVAIKPICEALGVSHQAQIDRLKTDPILSSVVMLSITTGSDGKRYEMTTIPFKFVFGWLFRIDSRNVKEEAREAVMKYQLECYNALYEHFTEMEDYLSTRAKLIVEKYKVMDEIRQRFRDTQNELKEAKNEAILAESFSLSDYRAQKAQLKMQFPDDEIQDAG